MFYPKTVTIKSLNKIPVTDSVITFTKVKEIQRLSFLGWLKKDLLEKIEYLCYIFLQRRKIIYDSSYTDIKYNEVVIDTQKILSDNSLIEHIESVYNVDSKFPTDLLVGNDVYERIWGYCSEHSFSFGVPIRFSTNNKIEVYGLKVHIVPWMEGFIVINKEMLD